MHKVIKKIEGPEGIFYADVCQGTKTTTGYTLLITLPKIQFVDIHNIKAKQRLKLALLEVLEEGGGE